MDYNKQKKNIESSPRLIFPEIGRSKNTKLEEYIIAPSLAFIYQATHPENRNDLPKGFEPSSFVFRYEDAIECSKDIQSPKWELVEKYLTHFEKQSYNIIGKIDKEFLLHLLKTEVFELQKRNITLLHSKNIKYLVLDILSQLISGSNEGFRPKCKREIKNQSAIQIMKKLIESFNLENIYYKDHHPEVRQRLISTNMTIFNNAYIEGESTLMFLYYGDSIMKPSNFLDQLSLSRYMKEFIDRLMDDITKIGKYLIVMYSIPINKLETYVYPSEKYGEIDSKQESIYKSYTKFLSKTPWKSKFEYYYRKQTRIVDLCFTKYAYKDGVRIKQFTDIPASILDKYIQKIDQHLSEEQEINDWVNSYIDIAEQKLSKPFQSIQSYKERKFLISKEEEMLFELDSILPKQIKGVKRYGSK